MSDLHHTNNSASEASRQLVDTVVLCLNNCGFYGRDATRGYCSKCFKDLGLQSETKSEPSVNAAAAPMVVAEDAKAPVLSAAGGAEDDTPAPRPVQKKKNRCWTCKRKVGIVGFDCRCDYTFCARHRYPHDHSCDYDFRKAQQEKLREANPNLTQDKFEKI